MVAEEAVIDEPRGGTTKSWSDFKKAIDNDKKKGTNTTINAYAGPNGNIYQAAAEYALEQQRRTGLYGY